MLSRFPLATIDSQVTPHLAAQSAGPLEYTNYISEEGYPPVHILDMKLNKLMVKPH